MVSTGETSHGSLPDRFSSECPKSLSTLSSEVGISLPIMPVSQIFRPIISAPSSLPPSVSRPISLSKSHSIPICESQQTTLHPLFHKHSHSLPRNNPIAPTSLPIPLHSPSTSHKLTLPINLQASKDVFRPCNASIIRRRSHITDM